MSSNEPKNDRIFILYSALSCISAYFTLFFSIVLFSISVILSFIFISKIKKGFIKYIIATFLILIVLFFLFMMIWAIVIGLAFGKGHHLP